MRILMISPAYAPYGGVGSARMISLSEYLVQEGDNVTVLCNSPSHWGKESLVASIPMGIATITIDVPKDEKKASTIYLKKLDEILTERKFDICLFSVGPYYFHYLINDLIKLHDFKYVVDYRDSWLFVESNASCLRKIKRTAVDICRVVRERRNLKNSAAVVCVTHRQTQEILHRHRVLNGKVFTIRNGYAKIVIDKSAQLLPFDGITIALAGKFSWYNFKLACATLTAIKKLNDREMKVRLIHIGGKEEKICKYANAINLQEENFICVGYKEYSECLSILANADILLINYYQKIGLGTKIFDYIFLDKPILATIPKESEMADLISKFENGFVAETQEEMVNAITTIRSKKLTCLGCKDISSFSREKSNCEYRILLEDICSNKIKI